MAPVNAQEQDDADEPQGAARRPEATAKVGNVEIAIWRNQGSNGEFYSASSPVIRYREGQEWKDGSSYGVLDLLALSECAREASAKIRELSRGRGRN